MWFVFGLITLASFSIYFGVKRFGARWKGERAFVHNQPAHEYEFVLKKDTIKKMRVGLDAPKHFDFTLKRESAVDRFCKFLGLSVEHQIGNHSVDRLVYIVSNDQHLLDQCMKDTAMVEDVQGLFNTQHLDSRITHVHCRNGRIWAEFKVGSLFNDRSNQIRLSQIFPKVATRLQRMTRQLGAHPPSNEAVQRDPFILRAVLVLAISTGLLVNGLAHAFRQLAFSYAITVDTVELWTYAAFGGAAIVAALIVLAIFLLGRTARTHLVLIEIVLVGALGALLTAFTEIRDLNMDLDTSSAHRYEARVVDKTISKSRKSGTRYYLHVPGWTGQDWTSLNDTERLQVSGDFYQRMQKGERIEIWQRSGFLGIRWVESVGRAPKP